MPVILHAMGLVILISLTCVEVCIYFATCGENSLDVTEALDDLVYACT